MPRGRRRSAPAYVPSWGRCRFCKESAPHSEMLRYSVRHWAHAVCLYRHKGIEFLNELYTWQLRHLPIVALMGAGVTLEQLRAWEARIDAEDAELAARGMTSSDGGEDEDQREDEDEDEDEDDEDE